MEDLKDLELELSPINDPGEKPEVPEPTGNEPPPVEADPTAQVAFEIYQQQGLIPEDVEFDGTFEQLEEYLQDAPNRVKNEILASVPSKAKDFVELILTKPDMSDEDFSQYYEKFLNDHRPTIETADDARAYLTEVYKKQGLRERSISAQLDDMEDDGTLLDTAKDILSKEPSPIRKELETTKQQLADQEASTQKFVSEVDTVIKTYSAPRQKAIREVNVSQVVSEISKNPKAYAQFLDILTYYKNGNFDLSVFEKQGATTAVNSLKDRLSQKSITTRKTTVDDKETAMPKTYELVV